MKALFKDRKGFSAYIEVSSPPPPEWRIAHAVPLTEISMGGEDFLYGAVPDYQRNITIFDLWGKQDNLPFYMERAEKSTTVPPKLPQKNAVKKLRELYYERRAKLKPSKELHEIMTKGKKTKKKAKKK